MTALGLVHVMRAHEYRHAFGRKIMSPDYEPKMLYVGEGINASIAVSEDQNGARYFHVSGKIEAGSYPADMRLQRSFVQGEREQRLLVSRKLLSDLLMSVPSA